MPAGPTAKMAMLQTSSLFNANPPLADSVLPKPERPSLSSFSFVQPLLLLNLCLICVDQWPRKFGQINTDRHRWGPKCFGGPGTGFNTRYAEHASAKRIEKNFPQKS